MKIATLIAMTLSVAVCGHVFAEAEQPISCKYFNAYKGVRKQISTFDQRFPWNSPECKIVGTKSVFPRIDKKGAYQFEKGVQLFVYQNKALKYICLPGWTCKPW